MIKTVLVFVFAFVLLAGCNDADRKKQQFISLGRLVYQKQCANCHQDNGNGYEALYPPINQSDYFLANPLNSLCLIVNGAEEPMTVNGKEYNLPMPSFAHLKPDELAKLLTYLSNSWDNDGSFYSEEDVTKTLATCSNK
ncbi:c-type cytochrome [bacterium]|nr:c-type cytochrome [bacterium]